MRSFPKLASRILRVLEDARKTKKGMVEGLIHVLKRDIVQKVGLYIQPVIEPPEQSDDAAIVDTRIHQIIEINMSRRETIPSVTAVFRIKNASPFLYLAVSSFVPLCSEIVIVDNDSSDESWAISEKLRRDYDGISEIKLFKYGELLARPGGTYDEELRSRPQSSIAAYYNFAFSKATAEYVIKADAHTLLMPFGVSEIQDNIENGVDIIYNTGIEIFGRKIDFEPRIYRRCLPISYVDGDRWEYLTSASGSISDLGTSILIWKPVFLHLKAMIFARGNASSRLGSRELYGYSFRQADDFPSEPPQR